MIGTVEGTNRANTSNKVMFPEFYRLVNSTLGVLVRNFPVDPSAPIHYTHEKESEEEQQSNNKLRLTEILKKIQIKGGKKNKKENDQGQIASALVAKILELILRSFAICKNKSLKKIDIIENLINKQVKSILGDNEGNQPQTLGQ